MAGKASGVATRTRPTGTTGMRPTGATRARTTGDASVVPSAGMGSELEGLLREGGRAAAAPRRVRGAAPRASRVDGRCGEGGAPGQPRRPRRRARLRRAVARGPADRRLGPMGRGHEIVRAALRAVAAP